MTTQIEQIINDFKLSEKFPKHVDVTKLGSRYWVACYDNKNETIVMDDLSTAGFASDPKLALLKSLSEKVEREAFRSGHKKGIKACLTDRSDGFAAYPKFDSDADHKVRESALSEAIERFVWSSWWDDESIEFDTSMIPHLSQSDEVRNYLKQVMTECQLGEIFVVQPKVIQLNGKHVTILFGHLKSGGFISGGACGEDIDQTLLRALDELLRHGLALTKLKNVDQNKLSFYEKRLAYFGFGQGNHLVSRRLSQKGNKSIHLPELEIDQPIETEYQNIYLVYRCLFKNQPPFIGGELERMCL